MTALITRWMGLLLGMMICLHGAALMSGQARSNAVLAYVEQYGESTQLRIADVDRRLDRHVRSYPDCYVDWLGSEWLIFSDVSPGQRPRLTLVSPWHPTRTAQLTEGQRYEEAAAVSASGQIAYAENWTYSNSVLIGDGSNAVQTISDLRIWITSLQWSRDGRWILAQGTSDDLSTGTYLIDVPSGAARPLLLRRRARLMPDGGALVYDLQGSLLALEAQTGVDRVLLDDERVNWQPVPSPDGWQIAYVSEGVHLHLLDLGTGTARRLTDRAYADIGLIAWSPDGTRIAFAARPLVDNIYALLTPYNIEIVNTADGMVSLAKRGAGSYVNNFSRFCAFAWMSPHAN